MDDSSNSFKLKAWSSKDSLTKQRLTLLLCWTRMFECEKQTPMDIIKLILKYCKFHLIWDNEPKTQKHQTCVSFPAKNHVCFYNVQHFLIVHVDAEIGTIDTFEINELCLEIEFIFKGATAYRYGRDIGFLVAPLHSNFKYKMHSNFYETNFSEYGINFHLHRNLFHVFGTQTSFPLHKTLENNDKIGFKIVNYNNLNKHQNHNENTKQRWVF